MFGASPTAPGIATGVFQEVPLSELIATQICWVCVQTLANSPEGLEIVIISAASAVGDVMSTNGPHELVAFAEMGVITPITKRINVANE